MPSFKDLFGLHRRREPRIAVNWLIDIQVPETQNYVGFITRDISTGGVCLSSLTPEGMERVGAATGRVKIRLRIPGNSQIFEVEAHPRGANGAAREATAGWEFTRMSRGAKKALEHYIQTHPEDLIDRKG